MADIDKFVLEACPICSAQEISLTSQVKDYSISKEEFELWSCHQCDFLFTQHAPAESKISRYYASEDYISHSDKKSSLTDHLYHLARKYMLGRKWQLVNRFAGGEPKALLDYGSGTGYFLDFVKRKGWNVHGIEVSDDARTFCQQKFGIDASSPTQFFDGSEKYDVITLWHVLEHLYDLKGYMHAFHQKLNEGGKLIIAVPNRSSLDASAYGTSWAAFDVPRHLWHFTPSDLNRLAKNHGFKLVAKKGMPLDAFYVSLLSAQYQGSSKLKALWNGLKSNLSARFSTGKYSSMIYILEK